MEVLSVSGYACSSLSGEFGLVTAYTGSQLWWQDLVDELFLLIAFRFVHTILLI